MKIAAQALRKAGIPAVYKKIDSTFRGNIAAELDAALDVFPVPLAVLTPAFPPAGRSVPLAEQLPHGGGALAEHGQG